MYEIRSLRSAIKPRLNNETVSFEVEIATEGKLREDWVHSDNAFESDMIRRAEQATEASIREIVEKTLAKMQNELKVDVAGFGKRLNIAFPMEWKKRKNEWDRQFSEIKVEVKVNATIQEFGTKGMKNG
ncbi:Ger(x)C family spore germination C-terminal domain-containing protein [Paenibacillus flagellatus]|uniref:Ger(x)C family spore germination C-terminal domain-containing protein n=1 Tax=Paenibacillus flagellatus TaxID=2211139 RepID=UPI0013053B3A|nr:Ger(x)C family spore germination C-terminal domain-containing protein [Paenibacillus flagellatus]